MGPKESKLAQKGQNWCKQSKHDQTGPNISKYVQTDSNWYKIVQNGMK